MCAQFWNVTTAASCIGRATWYPLAACHHNHLSPTKTFSRWHQQDPQIKVKFINGTWCSLNIFPCPYWPVACGGLRHHPRRQSPVVRSLRSPPVPHPPSPAVVLWAGPTPWCRPEWLLIAPRYEPVHCLTIANSRNCDARPLSAQNRFWGGRPVNRMNYGSPLRKAPTVNAASALCDMGSAV